MYHQKKLRCEYRKMHTESLWEPGGSCSALLKAERAAIRILPGISEYAACIILNPLSFNV